MKKRGMEDLIDVKLQLLHGVSYLILFKKLLQSSSIFLKNIDTFLLLKIIHNLGDLY